MLWIGCVYSVGLLDEHFNRDLSVRDHRHETAGRRALRTTNARMLEITYRLIAA
jgi:hypothetical protein